MIPDYKNILVINTMHIGDLMLVTPALRTLRANYPKAHIALLTDKPLADLVRCNENIDECILIDKHGRDKGILALIRFIRQIRKRHFDLVINYHRNERASAIASFSGGKKIVGYAQPFFHRFFDHWMPNLAMADTPKDKVMHQTLCHLKVLQEAAGCTKLDDRGLEMWLPPEEEKKASDLWQKEFAEDDRVIAFNIGASWMTKRWIDAYFAECADHFIQEGYHIAFLGGPTDVAIVKACQHGKADLSEGTCLHRKSQPYRAGGAASPLLPLLDDRLRPDARRRRDECTDRHHVRREPSADLLPL